MKRTWTIIGVGDVARSFEWYQTLFGQPLTRPAHDDFGQLCDSDGTVLLCLHQWGAHEHPPLMSPEHGKPGNGLLLFFRVDDFSLALKRARALVTRLDEEPHESPNTGTMEFALRDPDGYYVMISALVLLRLEVGRENLLPKPLSSNLDLRPRGSTSGRTTQAADRQIDDFIPVPNSRQGCREARPVARTSRPSHPLHRCRQRRELPSRDTARAGPAAACHLFPRRSPW